MNIENGQPHLDAGAWTASDLGGNEASHRPNVARILDGDAALAPGHQDGAADDDDQQGGEGHGLEGADLAVAD